MPLSRQPRYAAEWQARRQTRVKASGMTAVLQKFDAQWRGYDRAALLQEDAGRGARATARRHEKALRAALAEVQRLARKREPFYDATEKAVLQHFFDDVNDELAFWAAQRQTAPGADAPALERLAQALRRAAQRRLRLAW